MKKLSLTTTTLLLFVLAAWLNVNIIRVVSAADVIPPPPEPPERNRNKTTEWDPSDSEKFKHFVAHNSTMTCSADEHSRPFNGQIRGVNLGGWFVLEPWITPSLFYQFLGKGVNETAFDMYTFCEVLGPEEGNVQLRRHWDTWITEDIIRQLADSGAVNSLRLPVGDFMYKPYGPYIGCADGALEYVDRLLDWSYSHGLTVLIDIHTMKDSQNGFDNSGQAMGFQWTSALSREFSDSVTFAHWPIRSASWIGTFDPKTGTYSDINYENIQHSLQVISNIVDMYTGHPGVMGLQPVNEPWNFIPLDVLKRFYWEGYLIVKRKAPYWRYIMHDSFRLDPNVWGGFMDGCPERVLDTHIYQAWMNPGSRIDFYTDACGKKSIIAEMEREFGPVVVGEWSLATDNCAMWLNGFNDNLPGFPRLPCKYTPCADPYMGTDQPGTPVDPSKPLQGPFGTGQSGPIFGLCPTTRDWLKEHTTGNPFTGQDWIKAPPKAPKGFDDTDDVMRRLALKKIDAFAGIGHGFFFWTARTDLYDPQWSYLQALDRGWIPSGNLGDTAVTTACSREDKGEFKCVLKKGQLERSVRGAVEYCLTFENTTESLQELDEFGSLTGKDFDDKAQDVLSKFFEDHRHAGATCDFGGIAMLVELNRTMSDDDAVGMDDDEYFGIRYEIERRGPPAWVLGILCVGVGMLGGVIGFIMAMRYNPSFNQKIRESVFFQPLTKSDNKFIRSSLALPELASEDEVAHLIADMAKDEHRK